MAFKKDIKAWRSEVVLKRSFLKEASVLALFEYS